jgi:hypothetical protein
MEGSGTYMVILRCFLLAYRVNETLENVNQLPTTAPYDCLRINPFIQGVSSCL